MAAAVNLGAAQVNGGKCPPLGQLREREARCANPRDGASWDPMNCRVVCLTLALVGALVVPSPVSARRDGIATESCNGCHLGGQEPGVRVLASAMNPSLGQMVAMTVEIDSVNGSVGGFYLKVDGGGTVQAAANSGMQVYDATSIGHSTPKAASGGVVRFAFNWAAPSTPGGVAFRAFAVSGNGDDTSRGDGVGEAELLLAYGCTGELYTADLDGDGYGAIEYGQKRDCSMPQGHAARDGDCEEYEPNIHPGAAERCNKKDDDCDGKVDEALPIGPQYRDGDGDGYGSGADSIMDCSSPKGYAAEGHDCDDAVATTHPQADETCNLVDDDCDGRIDENVRPACGVGWCRRLSDSCDPSFCTPGKPRAEECNAFDDDCDDKLDEDVTCPGGGRCTEGRCSPPTAASPDGGVAGSSPSAEQAGASGGRAGASAGGSGSRMNASAACGAGAGGACEEPAAATKSEKGGCSVAPRGRSPFPSWAGLALWCAFASFNQRRRQRERR